MLPAARVGSQLLDALPWTPLSTLTELERFREEGYALCGLGGRYYAANVPLPSQWIRRRVVEWMELDAHWDWGAYNATLEQLRLATEGKEA